MNFYHDIGNTYSLNSMVSKDHYDATIYNHTCTLSYFANL